MNNIINWFAEPLAYTFMQNALWTALIVGVICAVLSCYLILKSWALMGDAISHAILPGVVIAYTTGIPLIAGAFGAGVICSLTIGYLKEHSRIKEDTVMGIVFSGMFALGLVMFVKAKPAQHLTHILFGNLLGVSTAEVIQTLIISTIIFLIVVLKRRDFLLYCFDPTHTKVSGLSPRVLHYSLLALLSLTIVTAMQVVGVILVVAMLISPGITAFVLTKRFDMMLVIAIVVSVTTSVFGTIVSYHINGSTGACIVILQAIMFSLSLSYTKFKNQLKN